MRNKRIEKLGAIQEKLDSLDARMSAIEETVEYMDNTLNHGLYKILGLLDRLQRQQSAESRVTIPKNLTTAEAADVLGVNADTIRRWIGSGKICSNQIEKRHYIPREEVVRVQNRIPLREEW